MDTAQQLLIPEKIKVGFQERSDTYTKRLAYVIYYDKKGVLRKEKSWKSWRDEKIKPEDYTNEPTEGFVLNRKVGGYKSDWNYRDAHVRVYDPRGFEFEISVPNLLFILRECDCSRGKGLEGKFVYAWEGTELILLPTESPDYKKSAEYTDLQGQKVKAKELILGASYKTKKQEVYVYLGKFIKHVYDGNCHWDKDKTGPKQVFWDGKNFIFLTSMAPLAVLHSDAISPDYAELVDKYNKSVWGSKPVKLFAKKASKPKRNAWGGYDSEVWASEESPGVWLLCSSHFQNRYDQEKKEYVYVPDPSHITVSARVQIKDGVICSASINKYAYRDKAEGQRQRNYYGGYRRDDIIEPFIEPTGMCLWAELESGSKFKATSYNLIDHTVKPETYDDDEED